MALAGIIGWILLFTVGMTVNTRPLRARYDPDIVLDDGETSRGPEVDPLTGTVAVVRDLSILFLTFTPPNLALLCVLSGLLGALGARVRLGPDDAPESGVDQTHPYLSGALRGFFVYLIVLSGTFALSGTPFEGIDSQGYARLAGFVSLISFALSYAPRSFANLIRKADGLLAERELRELQEARGGRRSETRESER